VTSFSVVAIVKEPLEIVQRFLRWYIGQGASNITLFFDDPHDPAISFASGFANVTAVPCTPALWSEVGVKHDARFTRRQNNVLTYAYYRQTDDWMLNVDADELMYFHGESIADRINSFDLDASAYAIRTAEHVLVPASQGFHFRTGIEKSAVRDVFGANADLFLRRRGLAGHPEGKSFIRTGLADIRLRQHWAEYRDGGAVEGPVLTASDAAFLLHFMVEDYASWRGKLDWRVNSWGYPQPIKDRVAHIRANSADIETDLKALYQTLHELPPEKLEKYTAAGGIHRFALDI